MWQRHDVDPWVVNLCQKFHQNLRYSYFWKNRFFKMTPKFMVIIMSEKSFRRPIDMKFCMVIAVTIMYQPWKNQLDPLHNAWERVCPSRAPPRSKMQTWTCPLLTEIRSTGENIFMVVSHTIYLSIHQIKSIGQKFSCSAVCSQPVPVL